MGISNCHSTAKNKPAGSVIIHNYHSTIHKDTYMSLRPSNRVVMCIVRDSLIASINNLESRSR